MLLACEIRILVASIAMHDVQAPDADCECWISVGCEDCMSTAYGREGVCTARWSAGVHEHCRRPYNMVASTRGIPACRGSSFCSVPCFWVPAHSHSHTHKHTHTVTHTHSHTHTDLVSVCPWPPSTAHAAPGGSRPTPAHGVTAPSYSLRAWGS